MLQLSKADEYHSMLKCIPVSEVNRNTVFQVAKLFEEELEYYPTSIIFTEECFGAEASWRERTLRFSDNYLSSLSDEKIFFIVAHELAHIYCHDTGTFPDGPSRHKELLCDYIAGWLLGRFGILLSLDTIINLPNAIGYWGDHEHPDGYIRMQWILTGNSNGNCSLQPYI